MLYWRRGSSPSQVFGIVCACGEVLDSHPDVRPAASREFKDVISSFLVVWAMVLYIHRGCTPS